MGSKGSGNKPAAAGFFAPVRGGLSIPLAMLEGDRMRRISVAQPPDFLGVL